jgi:hypothetical protein
MSGENGHGAPTLRHHDAVISDRVDGVPMLCHTETAEFFKLNDTGALIWDLSDGRRLPEIIETVCARYPGADETRIADLVQGYVLVLEQLGLLRPSDESSR